MAESEPRRQIDKSRGRAGARFDERLKKTGEAEAAKKKLPQ